MTEKSKYIVGDNVDVLESLDSDFDFCYIDPPYNSRQYSDAYHLLENLALWKKPEVFGKAKKMDRSHIKSKYCGKDAVLEFQDLIIQNGNNKPMKLFEQIALSATTWKSKAVIGLVAGASYTSELENLRNLAPNTQILVPGIGAQGGDVKSVIEHGIDKSGRGLMINSSRSILYTSKSSTNYGSAANMTVMRLKDDINNFLCENGFDW